LFFKRDVIKAEKNKTFDIFSSNNFIPFSLLKKIMLSIIRLDTVISFANIKDGLSLVRFNFNDERNIKDLQCVEEKEGYNHYWLED
jgi:hypothetical protein